MTGIQIKGKGFRGALRYNLEKVEKNLAKVLDHSFVRISEKVIMKEVQMVRILKPNLQKFFYHTSLNFPPHENLSNDKMKEIARDYLHGNGFTQHQFIIFRHYDAGHPHLHILVNRINYDGQVLTDSNDFARSERVIRGLEKKYGLSATASSKQAKERALTKDEIEMMRRTDEPSIKLQLQTVVKNILSRETNLTCSAFVQALEKNGIDTQFNVAFTGHVSGISYAYNGMVITGSKLGGEFKWTTLKNRIDYNKERDGQFILETNLRAKRNPTLAKHGDSKNEANAQIVISGKPKQFSTLNKESSARSLAGSSNKKNEIHNLANQKPSPLDPIATIFENILKVEEGLSQSPEASLRLNRRRKRKKGFRR